MDPTINTLPMWLQFLAPILVALLTSIAGWIGLRKQFQKDKASATKDEAEAAQAIQEAALALLKPYQDSVIVLTKKVNLLECQVYEITLERDGLTKRVRLLEKGVDVLVVQLKGAGLDPAWVRNGGQ